MLAPQFRQFVPPMDPIEPIVDVGIVPIPDGGIAVGAIAGLNTRASIPPIKRRRNPMKRPPAATTQLRMDRTRTMTPHIFALDGFEYIITPPTIIISPKMTPTTPIIKTVEPAEPAPTTLIDEIIEPTNATKIPPRSTKIPPISDNTNAAVGFSANLFT